MNYADLVNKIIDENKNVIRVIRKLKLRRI